MIGRMNETGLLDTLCSLPHFNSNFPPKFEQQKQHSLSCAICHTDLHAMPHTCKLPQLMHWADGTAPQGKQTVILGHGGPHYPFTCLFLLLLLLLPQLLLLNV